MKIKDIAALAGVAPSTVSRVINSSGYVSQDVRAKVEKIIKETGYVPDNIAKSLKTGRTNTIGVILPQISSETVSKIVEGITTECKKEGYTLILANTGLDVKEEINYLKILQTKQVEGLIFMATEITKEHLDVLKELKIPIVITGQYVEGYTCFIHDDFNAAKDLANLVLDNNHEKIGIISVTKEDIAVKYKRLEGFLTAIKERGLKANIDWIEYGDFTIESGIVAMEKIWNMYDEKPTAIVAATDSMAIGAISYLTEIGIKVPEQCTVVGMGNNKMSKYLKPKLTTVEYFHQSAGEKAAQKLFSKIDRKNNKINKEYIPYRIIQRDSITKI